MARPIFEQNCAETVAAFRKGLSEEQFKYVLNSYRKYIRVAIGRTPDFSGSLFASPSEVWGIDYFGANRFRSQTCLNMNADECYGIKQAYSDSLEKAFGSSRFPFMTVAQDRMHSNGFSNPVRLAWMFAVLGVEVSGELLGELEAILWDEDSRGLSMCGEGLCERLPEGSSYQFSRIFSLIGLSSYFPFGEGVYGESPNPYLVVADGLMDPRRFTFLIATVIIGHWQGGTIDQAPVPGSKKWNELASATCRLTANNPNQLDFFAEVFGVHEINKERLWCAVGPFYDSDEISIDRLGSLCGKPYTNCSGILMLSIMLLLILFGTCVLGSIIAQYLEHSHLAH